jgi:heme exporter protein A
MPAATASPDLRESPHLAVRGLACRRGERLLFSPVDLSVETGRIVWLRGPNGQGKTTLLRTLASLSAPEAGTITWARSAPSRRFVYIAHANALKDDLSAAESLDFLLRLTGRTPTHEEIGAALERFAMGSRRDAPVRSLSQGQRRRVALARLATETDAATWLLDEPFDALDATGIETLNALLAAHTRRGGSVVLTSHVPLTIADPVPTQVVLEAPLSA